MQKQKQAQKIGPLPLKGDIQQEMFFALVASGVSEKGAKTTVERVFASLEAQNEKERKKKCNPLKSYWKAVFP